MRINNRNKLTIVFYRDQEQFNIVAIDFKNLSFYVQQQIDNFLKSYREYVRVYIDNIVIFFKILKEYLQYLQTIFCLLNFKNIILLFKKFFLDYFFVIFLEQKIDIFDLIVFVDKIAIIKSLDFLYKLADLKLYLDLTE